MSQRKRKPPHERVMARMIVEPGFGCWINTMAPTRGGYRQVVDVGDRRVYAHRVMYERFIGPIPEGMELDHLCRHRECCNPWHLEPVTHAVNMARSGAATATECQRGHPFDEANTYRFSDGRRMCRACRKITDAFHRAKREDESLAHV